MEYSIFEDNIELKIYILQFDFWKSTAKNLRFALKF